jgi:hypothetical protein
MAKTATKKTASETVVATMTFATQHRTVHEGDVFAAGDPLVTSNPSWFAAADTPTSELPNMWQDMPAPPEQVASPGFNVQVQSIQIPPHRQVRSKVSTWTPAQWAPGSPGAERGAPPPFGSAVRVGQVFDVGHPLVRAHPERFEFPLRDVTIEDVERMSKEVT